MKPDDYTTKGFRYYLPRPYVVVKEPFPVAGGVVLVSGTVDAANNVIRINPATVPDEVRRLFSAGEDKQLQVGFNQVLPPEGARLQTAAGARAQSVGGGGQAGAAGSTPMTSTAPGSIVQGGADGEKWLAGSKVEPSPVPKEVDAFDVTAVLTKDAPFQEDLTHEVVGFVPLDADGNADPSKFVAFKDQRAPTSAFKPATGGTYSARGARAELPGGGDYVVALAFTGKKTGEQDEKTYLVHRGAPGGSVRVFGAKPASDKPEEDEKAPAKEAEQQFNEISKSLVATSGDPGTDPLKELENAPFDILLLPDFDQQYAVDVEPGLGQAQAAIGLENGWMVERATISVDNRELGKFIFRQVDKFTDVARDVLALQAGLLLPPTAEPADTAQALGGQTVLLRLSYFLEAQPGIYPLLKPWEKNADTDIAAAEKDGRAIVMVPFRPYTVVAYNVRRQMVLERIDSTPQRMVDERRSQGPAPDAVNTILSTALPQALEDTGKPYELKSEDAFDWNTARNLTIQLKFKGGNQRTKLSELEEVIKAAVNKRVPRNSFNPPLTEDLVKTVEISNVAEINDSLEQE